MDFNFDTGTIDTISVLDTTEASPLVSQTNVLTIIGTGAITLPGGTTAQEPSPAVAGMFRYNSDGAVLEYYNGTVWRTLGVSGAGVQSITLTTSTGLSVNGGSTATITSTGTFALDLSSNLMAVSSLAGTGFVVYDNGTQTWSQVDITGTAGEIVVTNQDGTAGSPTISLAPVSNAGGGSLENISVDAYGRVTGYSTVTASQLESLIGSYYLQTAGGTMSGAINMGGQEINDLGMAANPAPTDAANVAYVQSLLTGLSWKEAVNAATIADLGSVTYNNGASGVGATLTNAGAQTALVVDGYTAQIGDRILVKNQTNQTQNGIYVVTATGSVSSNWVLTRSTDTNTGAELFGAAVYIDGGNTEANTGWTQTTPGTIVVGTTNVTWAQFSGSGTYTAGNGITIVGNAISLSTPVTIANGGTGQSTAQAAFNALSPLNIAGDTLYFNGTNNVALPIGSTGQVLTVAGGEPTWGTNSFTVDSDGIGSTTVALGGNLNIYGTTNVITTSVPTAGEVQITISSNYAGQSSINTVGTITAGTWQGTAISTQFGGTGLNTSSASNGQLLIGNGSGLSLNTISPGTGILVNNGAGTITLSVDPTAVVTSITTNTGLSVNSSATGAVTITNTGVTSFQTSLSGLSPSTSATGGVTLSGVLGAASGGTGVNNGTNTITLGGNIVTGGAFTTTPGNAVTLTTTGPTSVTLPTSGTLVTTTSAVTTFSLNDDSTTPIYTTTPTTGVSGAIAATITLNTQSAGLVFAGPATGAAAEPTFRALSYSDLPLKLYAESPSSPVAPTVSGVNTVAIGSGSSASQYGAIAFAGGEFANPGDAQHGNYILRNITTNNTPKELFLDGIGTEFIVPANSVVTFSMMIAARRTDATGGGAGYKFEGAVRRDATSSSVTLIGSPSRTILGETNAAWSVAIGVNTGTGGLTVTVTGENSKTIRWVAVMQTAEVTN
jgi:hypothetical protein